MNKIVKKFFTLNNLDVELAYTWTAGKPKIVSFKILHAGVDVTKALPKKRLERIIKQVTAALRQHSKCLSIEALFIAA